MDNLSISFDILSFWYESARSNIRHYETQENIRNREHPERIEAYQMAIKTVGELKPFIESKQNITIQED